MLDDAAVYIYTGMLYARGTEARKSQTSEIYVYT